MAIDLHISVTIAIQRSEHDAEGSSPVTKQHEETVSQRLLREDGPPLVHWMHSENVEEKEIYIIQISMADQLNNSLAGTIPGTFWMMLATSALKWQRMSFRVSESLSFSASSSCRVRSTYSSSVLFREWLSASSPPLDLKPEQIQRLTKRPYESSCRSPCFELHTRGWWCQHQRVTQISGPAGPWGCPDACVASCSRKKHFHFIQISLKKKISMITMSNTYFWSSFQSFFYDWVELLYQFSEGQKA